MLYSAHFNRGFNCGERPCLKSVNFNRELITNDSHIPQWGIIGDKDAVIDSIKIIIMHTSKYIVCKFTQKNVRNSSCDVAVDIRCVQTITRQWEQRLPAGSVPIVHCAEHSDTQTTLKSENKDSRRQTMAIIEHRMHPVVRKPPAFAASRLDVTQSHIGMPLYLRHLSRKRAACPLILWSPAQTAKGTDKRLQPSRFLPPTRYNVQQRSFVESLSPHSVGLSQRHHRTAGLFISFYPKLVQMELEFLPRKFYISPLELVVFRWSPQSLCGLHSVLVFTALSRRCQAAPQSRAAVLSLNHHILGYTKRPAITRNPARRASSACQVPPTVTSLFTINERFTLHQSLPLPIPSPAHIQARVVFCLLRDS